MKNIPILLLVFALMSAQANMQSDEAKFSLSSSKKRAVEHAKTGVFVRQIVEGKVQEFEVFIVKDRSESDVIHSLELLGYKQKTPQEKAALNATKQRFQDAMNPLKNKREVFVTMTVPK